MAEGTPIGPPQDQPGLMTQTPHFPAPGPVLCFPFSPGHQVRPLGWPTPPNRCGDQPGGGRQGSVQRGPSQGFCAFAPALKAPPFFCSVFPEQDVGKTSIGGKGGPLSQGEIRAAGLRPLATSTVRSAYWGSSWTQTGDRAEGRHLPITPAAGGERDAGRGRAGGGYQGDGRA